MKISRKPTPPRPTAPSRPSRLVTADTALARAKISGMGLGGPNWLPELPEGGSSAAGNLWDGIRRDHYRYAGVIGRLCHAFKRNGGNGRQPSRIIPNPDVSGIRMCYAQRFWAPGHAADCSRASMTLDAERRTATYHRGRPRSERQAPCRRPSLRAHIGCSLVIASPSSDGDETRLRCGTREVVQPSRLKLTSTASHEVSIVSSKLFPSILT